MFSNGYYPKMKVIIKNNNVILQKFSYETELVFIIAENGHNKLFELYKLYSNTKYSNLYEILEKIASEPCIFVISNPEKSFYYNKDISGAAVYTKNDLNVDKYFELRRKSENKIFINGVEHCDCMSNEFDVDITYSTFVYLRYEVSINDVTNKFNSVDDVRNRVMKHLENYRMEIVTGDYNYSLVRFENIFEALYFTRNIQKEFKKQTRNNIPVRFSAGIEYGKYYKFFNENSDSLASYNGIALNKAARMSKHDEQVVIGCDLYNMISDHMDLYKIESITSKEYEMKGFEKQEVYICKFK